MKLLIIMLFFVNLNVIAQDNIENFVFFNRNRERIKEKSFLSSEKLVGAQLKYVWKELEPQKDNYQFEKIHQDLSFLQKHNKKLFIQLQDVSFDTAIVNVPNYILNDTEYNGGVAIQYYSDETDTNIRQDGYVPRRWDPTVAQRFWKLLEVLGKEFDGKIEGINLPETAVGFGETGKLYPEGFSPHIYRDAIREQMLMAKRAFPNTVVIQYANFMPGEWLPWDDKGLSLIHI